MKTTQKRALTEKERNQLVETAQEQETLQEAMNHIRNWEKENPEVDCKALYEEIKKTYSNN